MSTAIVGARLSSDPPYPALMIFGERLAKLMADRGLTPTALRATMKARGTPISQQALDAIVSRPQANSTHAANIAAALKVSLHWLLTGEAEDKAPALKAEQSSLIPTQVPAMPIRYRVAAGTWQEVEDIDEPIGFAPIPYDNRFPISEQWAEQVVGDSFDLEYPDGSIVHVRDGVLSSPALLEGKVVVVERSRPGEFLTERTLKLVKVNKGKVELWPRSSNPKHQKPILLIDAMRSGEEMTVSIAGVVIGGYVKRA